MATSAVRAENIRSFDVVTPGAAEAGGPPRIDGPNISDRHKDHDAPRAVDVRVHLSSETEAIILEGTAENVTAPSHPLAVPSTAASKEKYSQYFSGNETPFRPFWAFRPTTAFAWTLEGFPRGATRWRFENS